MKLLSVHSTGLMSEFVIETSFDPTKLYFVFRTKNDHTARNLTERAINAWKLYPHKDFSLWLKPLEEAFGEVIRISCNETPVTRVDSQTLRLGKLTLVIPKELYDDQHQ